MVTCVGLPSEGCLFCFVLFGRFGEGWPEKIRRSATGAIHCLLPNGMANPNAGA